MRDKFPIFRKHPDLIYFDSAATAHKPQSVIDAITRFYAEDYGTVHRSVYRSAIQASEQYQESRMAAARFLHTLPEEIVFTRGTTDAINLVAQSYGKTFLKRGDEILIPEAEHHSNLVPWQMVAEATGALLRFIPVDEQGVLQWKRTIKPQTKLIALAHVSNVTGTIYPVQEICRAARAAGARVLIDGAQAAPHMKINVGEIDCDFYAFSGHKCYGPSGVGVLFGKKELLEVMPPIEGGGDMIERVELTHASYQPPPLRFEAGTPILASVVALKAALEFIERYRRPDTLTPYAMDKLAQIPGLKIVGTAPEKGPIITFHMEGAHPLDLAMLLDLKGIAIRSGHLCAQPILRKLGLNGVCRISFGLYNTRAEVDRFVETLAEVALQVAN